MFRTDIICVKHFTITKNRKKQKNNYGNKEICIRNISTHN